MPFYAEPNYTIHEGPREDSPRDRQGRLELLESEGSKPNKRDGAVRRAGSRKQEHPAIKY